MSNQFQINATARQETGKGHARRMRHQDTIPAVVYGAGKDNQSLSLAHNEIVHSLENEAVFSSILTLNIDGKEESVVVKSVQRHAYKPKIMHVDFLRIKAKDPITMHVPLHFINEEDAPGIKEGGVLTKQINDIEIKCLPADLPEFIEVDLSNLALEATLHLSDIVLPKKVTLTIELHEDNNQPIAAIHTPKVAAEPVEEDTDTEADESEATPEAGDDTTATDDTTDAE